MSEDVRAAVGKMSRVLRIAKDRANTQFGKVRERAKRFSLSGSQAAASASQSGPPFNEALPADLDKVRQLTDLGFSEVAARHALRACDGHLDLAGQWLLDEGNADEVLAAEVAAQEAGSHRSVPRTSESPALAVGGRARVSGLQNAAALNGAEVLLQKWDEASRRWIVSMPDGTVKSIRPQNLDPLYANQFTARAPDAAEDHCDADGERSYLDREELKTLARTMLESTTVPGGQPSATDEVLDALSESDLLELIDGLSRDPSRTGSTCTQADEPMATEAQSPSQEMPAVRPDAVDTARKLVELEHEEARLKSLAKAQAEKAEELEAREAALREAESELERRRLEKSEQSAQPEAALPMRVPFVVPKESVEEPSPTSIALEAERADLQRLREEVEAAAKDLELRQEAAQRSAEERELQLLEEESAQMKLASSLKDEEARLRLQRRSLGMLQQAILKAADRPSHGGYVEHTMNDDAEPAEGQDVLEVERARGDEAEHATLHDPTDDDEVWDLDWSSVEHRELSPTPQQKSHAGTC